MLVAVPGRVLLRTLLLREPEDKLLGTAGFVGRVGRLEMLSIDSSHPEASTSHIEDDAGLCRASAAGGRAGSSSVFWVGSSAGEGPLESYSADHRELTVDRWDLNRSED